MSQNHTNTVIVGAGLAGLYLAWRLSKRGEQFVIFEKSADCGGRIRTRGLSATVSGATTLLPAELGAMRFTDRHVIFRKLIKDLGFGEVRFESSASYYLRGQHLTVEDFRVNGLQPEAFPYDLPPPERGRTPHELVPYVIRKAVRDCHYSPPVDVGAESWKKQEEEFEQIKDKLLKAVDGILEADWFPREEELTPSEWDLFKRWAHLIPVHGTEDPIELPLQHVGFWNLLKHYLSEEGFHLVNDGFGFASVVANWQAGEAMRWCIEDFSPTQKFYSVKKHEDHPAGITGVVEALRSKIEAAAPATLKLGHELTEVSYQDGKFKLTVQRGEEEEDQEWTCDKLVLCLPVRAMQRIRFANHTRAARKKWASLTHNSWPHRMVKIILLYREAWWKYTRIPGGDSGRIFTDIPERQVYYFGPEWLSSAGYEPAGHGILMIYNDSRFTNFWRPFSEHVDYWTPDSEAKDPRRLDIWFGPELNPASEASPGKHEVIRLRLVDKITQQLRHLHRYDIPNPIDGVWMDWTDLGAWHTWWTHVNIPATITKMLQPMESADFDGAGQAQSTPVPLYVCGEAFSDEQGWMEGALKSTEAVATRLGCEKANVGWIPEDDFKRAGYVDYETYMRHYDTEVDT